MLACKLCSAEAISAQCIGETKRPIWLRYFAYVKDAIGNKPDTPIGDRFGNAHSDARDIPS